MQHSVIVAARQYPRSAIPSTTRIAYGLVSGYQSIARRGFQATLGFYGFFLRADRAFDAAGVDRNAELGFQ